MENLKSFGIDNVAGHLRELISSRTSVGQFRLGQFTVIFFHEIYRNSCEKFKNKFEFYADAPTKSVNFTFALAKVYTAEPPPMKTSVFQPELAAHQAIVKLNESIQKDQLAFQVAGGQGEKLVRRFFVEKMKKMCLKCVIKLVFL